jgi:GT2 family glycosyltransferase
MTRVNILVLNWNQPQLTINTVKSILNLNSQGFSYHLYLVDNASSDDSFSQFQSLYAAHPKITLLRTHKNLGYVGGNNYGLTHFTHPYDYVLICNNDIEVHPDFLLHLLSQAKSIPTPSIIGPKIYFAKGYEYYPDRYQSKDLGKVIWSVGGRIDWQNVIGSNIGIDEVDHRQYDKKALQLDFVVGCCFLISKKIINKIGIFDDKYFMYLEDADFCQRAVRSGFRLAYCPQSRIWHLNAKSSGAGSSLHDYFLTRNRLLFGFRYTSFRTKFALFRESIRILINSPSRWQKVAVRDFYLKRLGQGSWQK